MQSSICNCNTFWFFVYPCYVDRAWKIAPPFSRDSYRLLVALQCAEVGHPSHSPRLISLPLAFQGAAQGSGGRCELRAPRSLFGEVHGPHCAVGAFAVRRHLRSKSGGGEEGKTTTQRSHERRAAGSPRDGHEFGSRATGRPAKANCTQNPLLGGGPATGPPDPDAGFAGPSQAGAAGAL